MTLTARRLVTRELYEERSGQQGERTIPKRSICRVIFAEETAKRKVISVRSHPFKDSVGE